MRQHVPAAAQIDEDELYNLIDIIFDYYETNGFLDVDADDDDDEPQLSDIVDYATRMVARDKGAALDKNLIPALVEAYLGYENSLDI